MAAAAFLASISSHPRDYQSPAFLSRPLGSSLLCTNPNLPSIYAICLHICSSESFTFAGVGLQKNVVVLFVRLTLPEMYCDLLHTRCHPIPRKTNIRFERKSLRHALPDVSSARDAGRHRIETAILNIAPKLKRHPDSKSGKSQGRE